MQEVLLTDRGIPWVKLAFDNIRAQGRIWPALLMDLHATTMQNQQTVQLLQLSTRVSFVNEVIGQGTLIEPGHHISRDGRTLTLEVPLSREALYFVESRTSGHSLSFSFGFSGLMVVREGQAVDVGQSPILAQPLSLSVAIPRSQWIANVLEPLGFGQYLMLEVPVPQTSEGGRVAKSLAQLANAQAAYNQGDDASVFLHCRAVFEKGVLDGAPKNIFDIIADPDKRKALDELLRELVHFLHEGRHPSDSGPQQGQFPVDHRDAAFALAMSQFFLSYIARLT